MSDPVHTFFSQWEIYRLCIEHNTLHHREVGAILRRELLDHTAPFTFLDLACGDAELTAAALRDTAISAYTGVDFSAPAVARAANKIAELGCPRTLHEEDFTDFLRDNKDQFDVIYLGLSLHHLDTATKREMMTHLRRATAPGGAFYLYPLAPGGSGKAFAERAVAEEKLIVVPGSVFGVADTHFRIAYTVSDTTLGRGIAALCRLAETA
jgi:SAM-dependent methyltransferase